MNNMRHGEGMKVLVARRQASKKCGFRNSFDPRYSCANCSFEVTRKSPLKKDRLYHWCKNNHLIVIDKDHSTVVCDDFKKKG